MITNIKVIVRNALISNDALILLLGKDEDGSPKVYQLVAPYANDYPRITFFEVVNRDSDFADDQPIASEIVVQIDVWNKGSTSAIAGEVDKTMKELGFSRTSSPDFYEEDTGVFHKAMRFKNIMRSD